MPFQDRLGVRGIVPTEAQDAPARAFRASGTVSLGEILYQAFVTRPSSSIRKDDQMIPMYVLPWFNRPPPPR